MAAWKRREIALKRVWQNLDGFGSRVFATMICHVSVKQRVNDLVCYVMLCSDQFDSLRDLTLSPAGAVTWHSLIELGLKERDAILEPASF